MKRKPTLLEAILPIAIMIFLLAFGYGYLKLSPEPLLILAAFCAGIIGLRVGLTWEEMLAGIRKKLDTSMPAMLILISIGLLIGTWMASGTIPMIIYYGLKIIDPSYVIVIAFIVTAIVSIITGTSWGAAGTVGIALVGIAQGLDAPVAVTAGAVVSGAYFGDKLSPLSDTTNLAPVAAGSELYEHVKHMLYTTIPATIISLIIYFFLGFHLTGGAKAASEKTTAMLQSLSDMFNWNLLLLLPPVIILYGSIRKKPTLPTIVISAIVAGILAKFVQGFSLKAIFTSGVSGFNVSMMETIGYNPDSVVADVATLLNRGGLESMIDVTLLVFCAFAFAGIISESGCLTVLLENLMKVVKKTGGLVLSTVISCITTALVTGSSYLSIIIPGEIFKETYQSRKLKAKNLSRTLEDSGTVVVPIIPWSEAAVYMAGTLGVSTLSYAPWAFLCYLGFIFAIIYGYTGFGIAKEESVSTSKAGQQKDMSQ
ncbi:transporter (NhaC family) [Scopulibacillus darangshiensis]|uniref:Transporter (NhaC family) n=1 Tax=Scopulibacillus darangshiensis TaxID=442528 RepID=A0A4R2P5W2_9BACL|nr:Na+/H+ antiporter NhaC [Scopulibacillus darangshiensis]TCP29598.1 transporter (NhaC family) [Scopulibacillus darangshiensis]